MSNFGREIVTVVEIDLDACTLAYGTSPCAAALGASGHKCFNTRSTCQDATNYTLGSTTIRFSYNQSGLPIGETIYPALQSITSSPMRINPNGIDKKYSPLGKREVVTIKLRDFRDADIGIDPYQAGRVDGTAQTDEGPYNPKDRGTFFTKLRSRNPFYIGRTIRILEGRVGDALSAMTSRTFVISKWTGPDASGQISIEAKDVLDLAENEKAVAPTPNNGVLLTDIGETLASFDLTPTGVGAEYPSSGRASIGSEILTFTRSGDTITPTARAVDGSNLAAHSNGDTFQTCYRVEGIHALDVVADLLKNYTGIDNTFVPSDHWASEAAWLGGFDLTCTIPKPTGVKDLISEICQVGIMIWWDSLAQEIKAKAVRPAEIDETYTDISDDNTIVEGSISVSDIPDSRLSRVRVLHGMTDFSGSLRDDSNYDVVEIKILADQEGNSQHSIVQEKVIYLRWLGRGQTSIASAIGSRLLARYKDIPQNVTFSADFKDYAATAPAALLKVTTSQMVDEVGRATAVPLQVISREEVQTGHALDVVAQSFNYDGRFGFIMSDSANAYDSATDAEKEQGCYIADSSLDFGDSTNAYEVF